MTVTARISGGATKGYVKFCKKFKKKRKRVNEEHVTENRKERKLNHRLH